MNKLVLNCLLVCLFVFHSAKADDSNVLYQQGKHHFTQRNALELIGLAEFLGRSQLNKKDHKALFAWSIEDYQSAPIKSDQFYHSLSTVIIPKIQSKKGTSLYRAEMYLNILNSFKKNPAQGHSPDNFLAVVNRYNPPINEAAQLQLLYHRMLQQQLQMNQMLFDQNMRQFNKSMDAVSQSITDQSIRDSITLPGGKILHESKDRIYAEDSKGRKFNLSK